METRMEVRICKVCAALPSVKVVDHYPGSIWLTLQPISDWLSTHIRRQSFGSSPLRTPTNKEMPPCHSTACVADQDTSITSGFHNRTCHGEPRCGIRNVHTSTT